MYWGWVYSTRQCKARSLKRRWTMKEFVEYLAKHLVDKSEAVIVELEEKDEKTIFKLKVDQTDVGKLIGKKGRTASAFRVLLRAVAAKEGKKAVLDIIG
jgi:hypothetical protein